MEDVYSEGLGKTMATKDQLKAKLDDLRLDPSDSSASMAAAHKNNLTR